MNKLSVFLLSASAPLVSVFDDNPIDSIVKKPSEEDMCAAKMQWIEGVPHNKLEKVYMSAVFDESMFKKLKDKDNLASEITSLIDREFAASGMTITPYSEIARKAKSDEELQSCRKRLALSGVLKEDIGTESSHMISCGCPKLRDRRVL